MPKVLRLLNRFSIGGPIHNAAWLTRGLYPEFETLLAGGNPLPDEHHGRVILDQAGVTWTELPEMRRSVNPFQDLRALREIEHLIQRFRPDIVHTHAAKAGALGRIAAHRCKVPVVVHTYHGHVFEGYFSPWKNKAIIRTERFLSRYADALIAISPQQQHDLVHRFRIAPEDKFRMIPLGLDLERFSANRAEKRIRFRTKYALNKDETAIGIIGRLVPVKHHALMISAFAHIIQRYPSTRLFIVGDGPLLPELMAQCASLNLSISSDRHRAHVHFMSWSEDVSEILPGFDLVTLTSVNEGTPVSLIEAQAACLPVVATDVGGVRDCVNSDQTGLLISSGDESALISAVIRLIENHALRSAMGQSGNDWVSERYHYNRLVRDMGALYTDLLSRAH